METKQYYRVYSINMAAFILMTTSIEPILQRDEKTKFTNFLFPVGDELRLVIYMYKKGNVSVDLHTYLGCYKEIRRLIKDYEG